MAGDQPGDNEQIGEDDPADGRERVDQQVVVLELSSRCQQVGADDDDRHTDQSVTQIGRSVGWPDQNYFARRFKAHFGLSATSYRSRFADGARQLQAWPSVGQRVRRRAVSPAGGLVLS